MAASEVKDACSAEAPETNASSCDEAIVPDGNGSEELEAQRRLAEEQAAEVLAEEQAEAGPKDWQRFYMGYHQVRYGPGGRGRERAGSATACAARV